MDLPYALGHLVTDIENHGVELIMTFFSMTPFSSPHGVPTLEVKETDFHSSKPHTSCVCIVLRATKKKQKSPSVIYFFSFLL